MSAAFAAFVPLTLVACGASETDKTPSQILQDASAALKSVTTYHLSGTGQSSGSTVKFDLRVGGPGAASGSLTMGGSTAHIVVVQGAAYLQGRNFWQQVAGSQAASFFGDNWVKVPGTASSDLTQSFSGLTDVKTLGGCLVKGFSNVSLSKSAATVNGQSVVALQAPALTMNFASSGPTYLVQVKSTGSTPSFDACMSGSSSSSSSSTPVTGSGGTINFDSWGSSITITPPPHALDVSALSGGG